MTDTDWRWLDSTVRLQREAYGHEPSSDPARQAASVRENVLALIVEATELLDNVKWKYWAHEPAWVRRDEVLKESVDIGHFHANINTAVAILDDEYWEAYREKQRVNRQRQLEGYTSRSAKETP